MEPKNEEDEWEEASSDSSEEPASGGQPGKEEGGHADQDDAGEEAKQGQAEGEKPLGCKHYSRFCEVLSPCCKQWVACRLCHDELLSIPTGKCPVERMDRQSIAMVRCLRCGKEQAVSAKCVECEKPFSRYYCGICHLFDDDARKQIYHCEKCQMCRIGTRERNVHCDKCNMCVSSDSMSTHKCASDLGQQNCPVCLENIKHSTKLVVPFGKCGHWIHQECQKQYFKIAQDYRCPLCHQSMHCMSQEEIRQMDDLVE